MRSGYAILDTLSLSVIVAMTSSRQFDIAVDFEFEVDAADRNDCPGRQCGAGQFSLRIGVANRLLDLSLGSDAELLEEPAYAGAEGVVVHNRSPWRVLAGNFGASLERNFNFATRAIGWECQIDGTAELTRDEIADEAAPICLGLISVDVAMAPTGRWNRDR